MPANTKIKTACPVCGAKYKVPSNAVGQPARCSQCKTRFRVIEHTKIPKHIPTEEDILSWLNDEAEEQETPPPSSRTAVDDRIRQTERRRRTAAEVEAHNKANRIRAKRLAHRSTESVDVLQFRRTG